MFTVTIKCKPYVRQYLVQNFGDPVNLSADQSLETFFRSLLSKPDRDAEKKYTGLFKPDNTAYSCTAEVIISQRDFYRHGWELTRTNTVKFGVHVENRVKAQMRNWVTLCMLFDPSGHTTQKHAILRFQDAFGFSEETWPYESIKKDFYRHAVENFNKLRQELIPTHQVIIDMIDARTSALM